MIRIGALISGSGTNLSAIMNACQQGEIDGRVVFAGADTPAATGLEKAARQGIPTFVTNYRKIIQEYRQSPDTFSPPPDWRAAEAAPGLLPPSASRENIRAFLQTRTAAEHQMLSAMAAYPFDVLVLAGFMRKLTPYFIDRVNQDPDAPRIMNIHPALLPAFPGVDGYGDTWRYGCKVGGCTVHFIDYGEDTGPIIGQKAFEIRPEDTLESVKAKGLALEWALYPECIQLFAQGRLKMRQRKFSDTSGHNRERTVVEIIERASGP